MDLSPLFPYLADILAEHPDGIREYDLLKALEHRLLQSDSRTSRADEEEALINLFRQHFLLFHLLYRYRDYLREHALGDLNIFCLDIRYIAPAAGESGQLPTSAEGLGHELHMQQGLPDSAVDGLRAYYLDWNNYENADGAEVRRMIKEGFSVLFQASDPMEREQARRSALEILGLEDPLGPGEARKRYRQLASIHHPDKGGNPAHFIRLTRALEVLQS